MSSAKTSRNPVRAFVEKKAFERLPALLSELKPKRVLIVLGGQSFRRSTYFPRLLEMLTPYRHFFSEPVAANPQWDEICEEIQQLKEESYDTVIAIGGGSVLDSAKLFATLPSQNEMDLTRYLKGTFELSGPVRPLIAIPTTAGTGSEVTPFSSIENPEKQKYSISHPSFYPWAALVDPELCLSMPAYVTACTGFDALSQAIESFWSVQADDISREHSLKGLERILEGFARVIRSPQDVEARLAMSNGSCEAGFAIAHAKTTAVHSVSYPMTSHFDIAHGHACALTLAEFVRFNGVVLKENGTPLLKRFHAADYEGMAQSIETLMDQALLKRSLSAVGIDEAGQAVIIRDGFRPDRVKNNPRPLTRENLQEILKKIR